jgi:hypothetical protein
VPQLDSNFIHIPVAFARQIGQVCHKDQVVILGFDRAYEMVSTATWGRTAEDKVIAAKVGQSLIPLVGGDVAASIRAEDFRDVDAGSRAAAIERLEGLCLRMQDKLQQALQMVQHYGGATGHAWAVELSSSDLMKPVA